MDFATTLALLLAGGMEVERSGNDIPAITTRSSWIGDKAFCDQAKNLEAAIQKELPVQADIATKTVGMSAICGLRTLDWNKFMQANLNELRDGWQGRKQTQWDDIICKNEAFGPAARNGWRFAVAITFLDGKRITIDAKC